MWLRGPQQFPGHRAADGVRLPQAQTRPGVPRTAENAEQSRAQRQPGKRTGGKQAAFIQSSLKYHLSERGRLEVRILEGKFQI